VNVGGITPLPTYHMTAVSPPCEPFITPQQQQLQQQQQQQQHKQ